MLCFLCMRIRARAGAGAGAIALCAYLPFNSNSPSSKEPNIYQRNTVQEPYRDSPPTSRSTTPTSPPPASHTKPLPSLPTEASLPPEPYRDEPSPSTTPENPQNRVIASPQPQRYHASHQVVTYFPPYTDVEPGSEDNDDVPLAHLYPYPTEAPPSYSFAVRQSYRDTLISHIPSNTNALAESDEEAGEDREYHDDVRFKIERIVAAIIVSLVLLVITGVLVGFIISMKIGRQWFEN